MIVDSKDEMEHHLRFSDFLYSVFEETFQVSRDQIDLLRLIRLLTLNFIKQSCETCLTSTSTNILSLLNLLDATVLSALSRSSIDRRSPHMIQSHHIAEVRVGIRRIVAFVIQCSLIEIMASKRPEHQGPPDIVRSSEWRNRSFILSF